MNASHRFLPSLRAVALGVALLAGIALAPVPAHARKAVAHHRTAGHQTQAAAAQGDYIVAVVNSEPVTNQEVNQRARLLAQQLAAGKQPVPAHDALLKQALDEVILKKSAIQSARNSGILVTDEDVQVAEAGIARQRGVSPKELKERVMAERHLTATQYRTELADQILLERVREARMNAGAAKATDVEALQWLREEKQKRGLHSAGVVPLINLAQVLVAVPQGASPEQEQQLRQKAEEALGKIRSGAGFAGVVRSYTDGSGRDTGGVMGLLPVADYPTEFTSAVQNLPVGQVTGLIRTSAGYHILKVVERQKADAGITQTEVHVRHILLRTGASLSQAQAVAQLAEVRRRIAAGRLDFAAAARQMSQDGSAEKGGDLGWTTPDQFVPEFAQALGAMQPGQISAPLVSRFGVHLVQLLEQRSAPMTQEQQLALARNALKQRKSAEALRDWEQQLRTQAYVEMRQPPR